MYDYLEHLKADIREAIEVEYDISKYRGRRGDFEDEINDQLWADDSVTGNASGSYTMHRNEAREYVTDNLALLADAIESFGIDYATLGEKIVNEEWETLDIYIRLHLLPQATYEVLNELEEQGAFEEQNRTRDEDITFDL